MKATEAKQKTDQHHLALQSSQYSSIIQRISNAVSRGQYEITIYEAMEPVVKKQIIDDGYKVGPALFERNEWLQTISWK